MSSVARTCAQSSNLETMNKRPDVDPASFDLAEHFLSEVEGSTEDDIWALAKSIQTICEDACLEIEQRQTKHIDP
jgi:hypothetical protein